jgi:hypothetical protein
MLAAKFSFPKDPIMQSQLQGMVIPGPGAAAKPGCDTEDTQCVDSISSEWAPSTQEGCSPDSTQDSPRRPLPPHCAGSF